VTTGPSGAFEGYAYFSMRVDQFFHVMGIFAEHHAWMRDGYHSLPDRATVRDSLGNGAVDEQFRRFCTIVVNGLNYMATTGIFEDAPCEEASHLEDDTYNFAFYTCFCFQWTLFENFVTSRVNELISSELLPKETVAKLRPKMRASKQMLDLIHEGAVFGESPFVSILPKTGWVPGFEEIGYFDLDDIRKLRNQFIHGIQQPGINGESLMVKQARYTRSMLILRRFAENIDSHASRIARADDRK
jgi:hypothetical protein